MPITYTPIRYPGGKSKLYPTISEILKLNKLFNCTYCEAFCGGGGLAMKLLLKGDVPKVIINDLDPAVFSMWDAIVNHAEELCEFISNVPLDIKEWKRHREICMTATGPSLELGKSAFYLNRTNRSGILKGGPIGGLEQNGKYKIDARFNRESLKKKIFRIASRSEDIEIYNMDAIDFIEDVLSAHDLIFANFDPPYVVKGPGLYKNSYNDDNHRELAKSISSCCINWIVTYDDNPLIDEIYADFDRYSIDIGYSAAIHRVGSEVLIASHGIDIPKHMIKKQS